MAVFTYEIKKMMRYQKGAVFIAVVLLLSFFWLVASDKPANSAMEQYRSEYEWYLEQISGKCTEEKASFLEQEALNIKEAKVNQEELLESYYDGKMAEDEYERAVTENNRILEHQNGFEVIYQQYLYICENTDNRYFLQTNGWSGLFGSGTLPIFLFLGILLFVTPVFCSEYGCQMDVLIITAKEGQQSTRYKIWIVLLTVVFLGLGTSLMEYSFYNAKYGLPNGNFPLQSLSIFADSTKDMTLFQGYVAVTVFRCFGGMFLAVLLLFVSVIAKKYAQTVLAGAVSVLIPYIGLGKDVIYRLPMPLTFLLGVDFLTGTVTEYDSLTGEVKVLFSEISFSFIILLVFLSILLCVLAVVWILRCNSNQWMMQRGRKQISAVLLLSLAFMTLTGCSGTEQSKLVVYNSGEDAVCMGYKIIWNETTQKLYLQEQNTGEQTEVSRSPLFGAFSEEEKIKNYFCKEPYLYYSTLVTENHIDRVGRYNSSTTKVSVMELNLETMQEKVIFEQVADSGRTLLGIEYDTGNQWEFLQYHQEFFLNEENIFFVDEGGIMEVNRLTKDMKNLTIPTNGSLAFDGENIFYVNEKSVLTKYNTVSGETSLYEDVIASDFCIHEDGIYYVSRTNSYFAYGCDWEGNNIQPIYEKPILAVGISGESLKVVLKENGEEITIRSK